MSTPLPIFTTINPNGTAADVSYLDDSGSHDSYDYTFTVYLKFHDPALNPPINPEEQDDWGWEAGKFSAHYKDPTIDARVKTTAQAYYDFLMGFRISYALESTINQWVRKYESVSADLTQTRFHEEALTEQNRALAARIKKLETDYVKGLEKQCKTYEKRLGDLSSQLIKMARALKDGK